MALRVIRPRLSTVFGKWRFQRAVSSNRNSSGFQIACKFMADIPIMLLNRQPLDSVTANECEYAMKTADS